MFIRELSPTVKHGLILSGAVLGAIIMYFLSGAIAPFLVSLVVAYVLNPLVRLLEGKNVPRPYAVLTLYVAGLLLGILIVIPLSVTIVSQTSDLVNRLSQLDVNQITNDYKAMGKGIYEKYSQIPWVKEYLEVSVNSEKFQELAARVVVFAKDLLVTLIKSVFGFFFSAFSSVLSVFLIPLFTFYILVDLDLLYGKAILLIPAAYRESILRLFGEIDRHLESLLRGQFILCLIFAALMTVGLWISGLHFALLLGPLSGIANMVPYLGGLVTVGLSILVALGQSGLSTGFLSMMLKVGITLAVIQGIDGFFLQPRIIGENVGLHPLAIMLALIIGGSIYGLFGMLVAVPMTCILKVLSRELYHELYDPT